ncbi:MAG: aminotransferase class V-fold PLP-dependent enzyme [Vulcanimicrobiaceae bacterium]
MSTATAGPALRERFPTLANATYLVSHSMGAAPLGARAALQGYFEAWAAEGPEAWHGWLPELAEIADGLGRLFGAPAGSISLVPNVSLAQAAVASALAFPPERCEVVVEDTQFPSVAYVWTAWERFGAKLLRVPSPDGRTPATDRIASAISERTVAVVVSHASYLSGALVDVPQLVARARTCGALVVLDTYQTAGTYPHDLGELGVDVAVGGSHKWLCGGPGCGFLYVRPSLRETLRPAITGWMAHEAPFAFEPAPIRLAHDGRRFFTGTPTVPGYLVARAGHAAIAEVGLAAIRAHNLTLTSGLIEGALERGLEVRTPLEPARRSGWIGIDFPQSERAYEALVAERIFLDHRPGCGLRVGPHFYTTDEEIARFFAALDRIRRML